MKIRIDREKISCICTVRTDTNQTIWDCDIIKNNLAGGKLFENVIKSLNTKLAKHNKIANFRKIKILRPQ